MLLIANLGLYTLIKANDEFSIASKVRELWSCDALSCTTCMGYSYYQYCTNSNQGGHCCTKTDGRNGCSATYNNCSTQFLTTENR